MRHLSSVSNYKETEKIGIFTSTLGEEGEHVARHEDLGQPVCPDYGVMAGFQELNQSTENHVYGCRI